VGFLNAEPQPNVATTMFIGNLYATVTVRLFQSQPAVVETARLFSPGWCDETPTIMKQSGAAVTVEGSIVTTIAYV
jgi:hypothetical protein